MTTHLILGGARSGKSRYAEALALSLSPHPVYLATSRRWDDDHQRRIDRHRSDRGPEWETLEEEKRLSRAPAGRVVVVDCVTLWLTNFFVDLKQDVDACLDEARRELDAALLVPDTTWLFVSNELGQGLHAPTETGRKFTDLQGFMNQALAARADSVCLMVAGIPLYAKGQAPFTAPPQRP